MTGGLPLTAWPGFRRAEMIAEPSDRMCKVQWDVKPAWQPSKSLETAPPVGRLSSYENAPKSGATPARRSETNAAVGSVS